MLDMGDPKLITLADEELPKGFSVVNLLVHKLAVISTALLLRLREMPSEWSEYRGRDSFALRRHINSLHKAK